MNSALRDRTSTSTSNVPEQLSLWVAPVAPPIVSFEPVPDNLKLRDDRLYMVIRQSGHVWRYPIQLTAAEVDRLARLAQRWKFSLGADGVPVALDWIHGQMEVAIDGGLS